MNKDFDDWNKLKKKINDKEELPFCHTREIWWSTLGLNVGSEEDGKNELYERPVLIIKVFNRNMVRIIPLTSSRKEDGNHVLINYENKTGSAKISQLKTISTKRLSRKMCKLNKGQFDRVIKILLRTLI